MTATMEPGGDITAEFEEAREAALAETITHQAHIGRLEAMERNGLVYTRWVARAGYAAVAGLVVACVVVIILLAADAAGASTVAQQAAPDEADNTGLIVLGSLVLGILFLVRKLFGAGAPDDKQKQGVAVLLTLGVVALLVFGLGWEVAECVAGQHFGDPGDGSNPFDQFCPFEKD